MKLKNILFVLLAVISTLFVSTAKAATTAPSSFTIAAKDLYLIQGSKYLGSGTLRFTYKKTIDGKIIYCTEIHDTMPTSGTETYKLNKELDARFAYVLANGYPTKSITGNNEEDYFITGLAIWYLVSPNDSVFTHFNLANGTYRGSASTVAKEIAKLVNGGSSYARYTPSIKINNKSSNMTLSSDGKYYVSNSFAVTAVGDITGGSFNVSLSNAPSGTIVTDASGNAKTTFKTTDKFIVKVPSSSIKSLSSEFTVNISGKGTLNRAYQYSPTSSSAYQSTVALYPENYDLKDSLNLKVESSTEVQITKIDAQSGKNLVGATLVLKKANGEEVETWKTTNEAKVFKNLPFGKYYVVEKEAPVGYILNTEKMEFEISENNKNIKLVFKNTPDVKNVYISKQDATTGEELPGAHLELYDEKGKLVEKWVSEKEAHVIKGLKPGKYTLKETIAPDGYILSTETVEFTVKEDGTVDGKVIMYNELDKKYVYISKQDATTGEELPGAHLELYDEDGNLVEAWVSGKTAHKIKGLAPGKYTLKETLAPEGYELSTETVEFTVKEDGTVDGKIIMYNKPETYIHTPNTSSFKTITASLIGVVIIGLGAMIIYRNYKKNEEEV